MQVVHSKYSAQEVQHARLDSGAARPELEAFGCVILSRLSQFSVPQLLYLHQEIKVCLPCSIVRF